MCVAVLQKVSKSPVNILSIGEQPSKNGLLFAMRVKPRVFSGFENNARRHKSMSTSSAILWTCSDSSSILARLPSRASSIIDEDTIRMVADSSVVVCQPARILAPRRKASAILVSESTNGLDASLAMSENDRSIETLFTNGAKLKCCDEHKRIS